MVRIPLFFTSLYIVRSVESSDKVTFQILTAFIVFTENSNGETKQERMVGQTSFVVGANEGKYERMKGKYERMKRKYGRTEENINE